MKKYILLLTLFSCNGPQGIVNGREFWIEETCIKSHQEPETGYHHGYYYFGGDGPTYGGHLPWQCGNTCTTMLCDSMQIDTIWGRNISHMPTNQY